MLHCSTAGACARTIITTTRSISRSRVQEGAFLRDDLQQHLPQAGSDDHSGRLMCGSAATQRRSRWAAGQQISRAASAAPPLISRQANASGQLAGARPNATSRTVDSKRRQVAAGAEDADVTALHADVPGEEGVADRTQPPWRERPATASLRPDRAARRRGGTAPPARRWRHRRRRPLRWALRQRRLSTE